MQRSVYTAQELSEVLGVSVSLAYRFIAQMNAELKKDGYITIRGKIPKAYADKRFFGGVS